MSDTRAIVREGTVNGVEIIMQRSHGTEVAQGTLDDLRPIWWMEQEHAVPEHGPFLRLTYDELEAIETAIATYRHGSRNDHDRADIYAEQLTLERARVDDMIHRLLPQTP